MKMDVKRSIRKMEMFQDEKVMPFKMFILQHLSKSKRKAAGFLLPSSHIFALSMFFSPSFSLSLLDFVRFSRRCSQFFFICWSWFSFHCICPQNLFRKWAVVQWTLNTLLFVRCFCCRYIFISFPPSLFVRSLYFNEHVLSLS